MLNSKQFPPTFLSILGWKLAVLQDRLALRAHQARSARMQKVRPNFTGEAVRKGVCYTWTASGEAFEHTVLVPYARQYLAQPWN